MIILAISLILFNLSLTLAHSTGAPLGACVTMIPDHGASPESHSSSPYSLNVASDPAAYNRIVVTLTTNGTQFKGILLEARATSRGSPVGSWQVPSGGSYKNLACNGEASSALTHTSSIQKSGPVSFVWIATATGNFSVYATVVTQRVVFFVMIPSAQFTVVAPTTNTGYATLAQGTTPLVPIPSGTAGPGSVANTTTSPPVPPPGPMATTTSQNYQTQSAQASPGSPGATRASAEETTTSGSMQFNRHNNYLWGFLLLAVVVGLAENVGLS